jgi:pre-mRNA-processing factor 39
MLQAIPLSVDLWIHYLNHVKQAEESKDNTDFIRQQYEKAVEVLYLTTESLDCRPAVVSYISASSRDAARES